MEDLNEVMETLEYTMSNKTRRHLIGGILMSLSLFFGGLAITAVTIKEDEENEYE